MPVAIPFTFTGGVGHKAKASEVNANFQALAAKFTEGVGGIVDGDCSTGMDLNANKLSSTAGKRITAAKFEPGAVDATALKSDAAVDANRAVTTDHLRDGAVKTAKLDHTPGTEAVDTGALRNEAVNKFKLSATLGLRATYAQLEMLVQEVAFTEVPLAVANSGGRCYGLTLNVTGPDHTAQVQFMAVDLAGGVASATRNVSPGTAIPTATNKCWATLKDVVITYSGGAARLNGKVVFVSLAIS